MALQPIAPLVWLNGRLERAAEAKVSVLDRGFLFGDGVYELIRFFDRVGVGMDLHATRLSRSLGAAGIRGFAAEELPRICEQLLDANSLRDACVYLQVTRGAGRDRSHIPPPDLKPTVFASASRSGSLESLRGPECVRAIVLPDLRWHRCEIKTISLMGGILPLLEASAQGADEAILHRDGVVSEGCSTNVFAWTKGTLVTPPVDVEPAILHGVSRALILADAPAAGIPCQVRPLTVEELRAADEIIITGSRRLASSVTELDGRPVGRSGSSASGGAVGAPAGAIGAPGAICRRVFDLIRQGVSRALAV